MAEADPAGPLQSLVRIHHDANALESIHGQAACDALSSFDCRLQSGQTTGSRRLCCGLALASCTSGDVPPI